MTDIETKITDIIHKALLSETEGHRNRRDVATEAARQALEAVADNRKKEQSELFWQASFAIERMNASKNGPWPKIGLLYDLASGGEIDLTAPEEPAPATDALSAARADGVREGLERAAETARKVGRPAGARDGETYIPGTSADAVRAILSLLKEDGQ